MLSDQQQCKCGRSPSGFCTGLHNMTNEQYQKHLQEQLKSLNEQAKPQLLKEG